MMQRYGGEESSSNPDRRHGHRLAWVEMDGRGQQRSHQNGLSQSGAVSLLSNSTSYGLKTLFPKIRASDLSAFSRAIEFVRHFVSVGSMDCNFFVSVSILFSSLVIHPSIAFWFPPRV